MPSSDSQGDQNIIAFEPTQPNSNGYQRLISRIIGVDAEASRRSQSPIALADNDEQLSSQLSYPNKTDSRKFGGLSCLNLSSGLGVSKKRRFLYRNSVESHRYSTGMDHFSSFTDTNTAKRSADAITDNCNKPNIIFKTVKFCYFREDFYSVGLAAFSSWIKTPADDLKNQGTPEAQKVKALIGDDPIIFSSSMFAIEQWAEQTGFRSIYGSLNNFVTCVSLSHLGFLCHTTSTGMIIVSKLNSDQILYAIDYNKFNTSNQLNRKSAIPTHIVWLHETRQEELPVGEHDDCDKFAIFGRRLQLLIGDSLGRIVKLSLNYQPKASVRTCQLNILSTKANFHADSICSMAMDHSEKYLCVVGTDNIMKVWTHHYQPSSEGKSLLLLKASINLPSAVRAINFCPGSSSLLAFGGGRNDRSLRILQIDPVRVLWEELMPAQIVATVWLSTRVILVAYGHSRVKGFRGLAEIIDVTLQKVLKCINGDGYALEAVKTQRGFCISTSHNTLKLGTWLPDSAHSQYMGLKSIPTLR